ncbi:hypothetical protein [Sphingomonas bacterium]|nr:hypothetical protein [Sphingomonas bacterium]
MSRPLIVLIVMLAVIIGGLSLLAGRAREKPVEHVEKAVSLANLAG